jgi:hypothetical protein
VDGTRGRIAVGRLIASALVVAAVGAGARAALAGGQDSVRGQWLGGAVVGVGHGSLTVAVDRTGSRDAGQRGRTLTVAVPAGTPVVIGKEMTPTDVGSVQVGWRAGILARRGAGAGGWSAVRVHVWGGAQTFVFGRVTSASPYAVTLAVEAGGQHAGPVSGTTITIAVDPSTQVLGHRRQIAVGDRVGALVVTTGKGAKALRLRDTGKGASR